MKPIISGDVIHSECRKGFWPQDKEFLLPFSLTEIEKLAKERVLARVTVPGVQPKLSLQINKGGKENRITIVGALQGNYILKPPHKEFSELPQMEAICMTLIKETGIKTVPFSLIRLKSGELAYLTKRIDRDKGKKIPMEDFCQLTERLTEHKYRGSHEQIAKTIRKYAQNPLIEVVRFYELVLACYLMGNNDMHLKNFSLIKGTNGYHLAPAYDALASMLYLPNDTEELALSLNGKRNRLKQTDFVQAMKTAGLSDKAITNLFDRIKSKSNSWENIIEKSFLTASFQEKLTELIQGNHNGLFT